jgi:hypothetical protein
MSQAGAKGGMRRLILAVAATVVLASSAAAGVHRDELTFLGRTSYLLREYSVVVPTDLKRQPVAEGTFLEVKAWGAWNGKWTPYVYEPFTVPGVGPDDVNAVMARYRALKPDSGLSVRREPDNRFLLRSEKDGSVFQLTANPMPSRVALQNPEGRLTIGRADGSLLVAGKTISGRVVGVFVQPGARSDPAGLYGLYDHFTLELSSGTVLVVYHSRTRPAFNLAALLAANGTGDQQTRNVRVGWESLARDAESGRDVPADWSVEAPDLGLRARLAAWGRNLVRYRTPDGKTAILANVMVRGSVSTPAGSHSAFGMNAHVQDE